jgi:ATP-dependent Lon protease
MSIRQYNIVLAGMPGTGKNAVGVRLAKATRRSFLGQSSYCGTRPSGYRGFS